MIKKRERRIGDNLGEFLSGDVLRVGMANSKLSYRMQETLHDYVRQPVHVSDGSGSRLSLSRPGWRLTTALDRRAALSEEKELDRLAYLDAKDAEFRNTSPGWSNNPPTGAGANSFRGGEEVVPEGTACTVRGPEFVGSGQFGGPGVMRMYKGKMTCVPVSLKLDGIDAELTDAEMAHFEYENYVTNAWRDGGRKKPPPDNEEESDDDEELGEALEGRRYERKP